MQCNRGKLGATLLVLNNRRRIPGYFLTTPPCRMIYPALRHYSSFPDPLNHKKYALGKACAVVTKFNVTRVLYILGFHPSDKMSCM